MHITTPPTMQHAPQTPHPPAGPPHRSQQLLCPMQSHIWLRSGSLHSRVSEAISQASRCAGSRMTTLRRSSSWASPNPLGTKRQRASGQIPLMNAGLGGRSCSPVRLSDLHF